MPADLDGCMVAIVPPDDVIDGLTVDGGEPADNIHLTVVYPGSADEVDTDLLRECVQEVCTRHAPLSADISGYGVFHNDESDVLHATVNLPGLDALKVDLEQSLEEVGIAIPDEYGLDPHITLLYSDSPILEIPAETPGGFEVGQLVVFDAGDRTTFELGGKTANVPLPEGEYKYRVLADCPDRCVTWDRVVTYNDLYGDGGPDMAVEDLARTSAAELLALSSESDTSVRFALEMEGQEAQLSEHAWLSEVDPEELAADIWDGLCEVLTTLGFVHEATLNETTYHFLISHTRRGDTAHVRGCSYLLARDVYRSIQIQAADTDSAARRLDPELRLCGHCMGGVA